MGLNSTNLGVFLCFCIIMPRAKEWFEMGQDVVPPSHPSIALDHNDLASSSNRDSVHSKSTGILN